jgi:predicted N-acyltransferase
MHVNVLSSISDVSAKQWNNLITDNNPFCRHEFLSSLEDHNCVGEKFGWIPRHIVVYNEDLLVGGAILYEKYNNYGEFVFDHAWHEAYDRYGIDYYPKIVSAIPYTPATGVRFLSNKHHEDVVYPLLLNKIKGICSSIGASSFHCLFAELDEIQWQKSMGLYIRHDCQFHWHNNKYKSFDDFLQSLKSKKRKNIRRERMSISNSGIVLRKLDGITASHIDWKNFDNFYQRTFLEKSGIPTLNLDFFESIASKIPDQIVLILADLDGECVAGSLMFSSDTHLYGRHWGCAKYIENLHFEACYYKGIEHCIENRLDIFEPGAQGEHKIARGFIPTITKSAHWIKDDIFREPINKYCQQESENTDLYIQHIKKHNPYRENTVHL